MYIPVSSSGIQLLLERPLLTTRSPLSSSGAHAEGEGNSSCFSCTNKQLSPHCVCVFNSFLKYATSFKVMMSHSGAKPWDYYIITCYISYCKLLQEPHTTPRLYLIIHSDMWSQSAYRCRQWHVLPPSKEPQIICFLPLEIIKPLRECV